MNKIILLLLAVFWLATISLLYLWRRAERKTRSDKRKRLEALQRRRAQDARNYPPPHEKEGH